MARSARIGFSLTIRSAGTSAAHAATASTAAPATANVDGSATEMPQTRCRSVTADVRAAMSPTATPLATCSSLS